MGSLSQPRPVGSDRTRVTVSAVALWLHVSDHATRRLDRKTLGPPVRDLGAIPLRLLDYL